MPPVIADPNGTRRVDTPRVVEVPRSSGHSHHVVMPEREPFLRARTAGRVVIAVVVLLLTGAGVWVFR